MFGLFSDLVKIAVAPVRLAVAVVEPAARIVTEPVADIADELVRSIEDALK